jgi:hypothetical protein
MSTRLMETYLFQDCGTEGSPMDALQHVPRDVTCSLPMDALQHVPRDVTPSLPSSMLPCIPFQSPSHSLRKNVGTDIRSN